MTAVLAIVLGGGGEVIQVPLEFLVSFIIMTETRILANTRECMRILESKKCGVLAGDEGWTGGLMTPRTI